VRKKHSGSRLVRVAPSLLMLLLCRRCERRFAIVKVELARVDQVKQGKARRAKQERQESQGKQDPELRAKKRLLQLELALVKRVMRVKQRSLKGRRQRRQPKKCWRRLVLRRKKRRPLHCQTVSYRCPLCCPKQPKWRWDQPPSQSLRSRQLLCRRFYRPQHSTQFRRPKSGPPF
jgi:hypothetical protein